LRLSGWLAVPDVSDGLMSGQMLGSRVIGSQRVPQNSDPRTVTGSVHPCVDLDQPGSRLSPPIFGIHAGQKLPNF
jgi:hypothetical protein